MAPPIDSDQEPGRASLPLRIGVAGAVASSWVASTEFAAAFARAATAPIFVVWYSTGFVLLCGPVSLLVERARWRRSAAANVRNGHGYVDVSCEGGDARPPSSPPSSSSPAPRPTDDADRRAWRARLSMARYAPPFFVLWCAANVPYIGALSMTTPAICTAVFATTPCWVYVFSLVALRESTAATPVRSAAVALAVVGVVIVAAAGAGGLAALARGGGSGGGGAVALVMVASFAAAGYKVAFARTFGARSGADVAWFLTALAALSVAVGALVAAARPLWIFAGLEGGGDGGGAARLGTADWANLTCHALASVAFNFAVNWGVVLTSPLDVALGTILGIPLALAVDVARGSGPTSAGALGGCAIIALSLALQLRAPQRRPRAAEMAGSLAALPRQPAPNVPDGHAPPQRHPLDDDLLRVPRVHVRSS